MVDASFEHKAKVAVLHEPPASVLPKLIWTLAQHQLSTIVVSHHHPDKQVKCGHLYLATYGVACRYLMPDESSEEHRFATDLGAYYGSVGLFISFTDRRMRGAPIDWLSLSNEASSTLLSASIQPRIRLLKAIRHLFIPDQSIVINAVIDDDSVLESNNGQSVQHLSAISQQTLGTMFAPNLAQRGVVFKTVMLEPSLCDQNNTLNGVIDPLINDRLMATS